MKTTETFNRIKQEIIDTIVNMSIAEQVDMLTANFGFGVYIIDADDIIHEEIKNDDGKLWVVGIDGTLYTESDFEEYIENFVNNLAPNSIVALWSQQIGTKAELSSDGVFVNWNTKE